MRRTATAATFAILFLPALVRAQEPVKSFDQLNTRLKGGDEIIVIDTQGRESTPADADTECRRGATRAGPCTR